MSLTCLQIACGFYTVNVPYKDLIPHASVKQLEWFERTCIRPYGDRYVDMRASVDVMKWLYTRGVWFCYHVTHNNEMNWCMQHTIAWYSKHDDEGGVLENRDDYSRADIQQVIISIATSPEMFERYRYIALGRSVLDIAFNMGMIDRLIKPNGYSVDKMSTSVAMYLRAGVYANKSLSWWCIRIDDNYTKTCEFLSLFNNHADVVMRDSWMSEHAIRWCIENNMPIIIGYAKKLPIDTILAYIDTLGKYIMMHELFKPEHIPIVWAMYERGYELSKSLVTNMIRCGLTGEMLRKFNIRGKKHVRTALKCGNISALVYLYPLTKRRSFAWFMQHTNARAYDWVRANVPVPKHRCVTLRRMDTALIYKLRRDRMQLFIHSSTKMTEAEMIWLRVNKAHRIVMIQTYYHLCV